MQPENETTTSKIASGIFGIAFVFCGMEMVEGWGILNLGWPASTFYAIMIVSSVVAGALLGGRYLVPNVIAAPISGVGGLYAIAFVLDRVEMIYQVFIMLVGLAGCLPGIGIYVALRFAQDQLFTPDESDESTQSQNRAGAELLQAVSLEKLREMFDFEDSFVVKFIAVLAVVLAVCPIVGPVVALIALVLTLKSGGWPRATAIVGCGISAVASVVFLVMWMGQQDASSSPEQRAERPHNQRPIELQEPEGGHAAPVGVPPPPPPPPPPLPATDLPNQVVSDIQDADRSRSGESGQPKPPVEEDVAAEPSPSSAEPVFAVPLGTTPRDASKQMADNFGAENVALLVIRGTERLQADAALRKKLQTMGDPGQQPCVYLSTNGDTTAAVVAPVADIDAFSRRIDFGKITSIDPSRRMIVVAIEPSQFAESSASPQAADDAAFDAKYAELISDLESNSLRKKREAFEALAETRHRRAAEAIAARLPRDGITAMSALKEMGPVAETPLWKYLGHSDHFVRSQALTALGDVATEKSIPTLQRLVNGDDSYMSAQARVLLKKIQRADHSLNNRDADRSGQGRP